MDYQSAIRMYVQPGRSQQEKEELGRRVKELTGYVALPHGRQAKYTDRANRAVFRSMAQELTQSGALQKKSNENLQEHLGVKWAPKAKPGGHLRYLDLETRHEISHTEYESRLREYYEEQNASQVAVEEGAGGEAVGDTDKKEEPSSAAAEEDEDEAKRRRKEKRKKRREGEGRSRRKTIDSQAASEILSSLLNDMGGGTDAGAADATAPAAPVESGPGQKQDEKEGAKAAEAAEDDDDTDGSGAAAVTTDVLPVNFNRARRKTLDNAQAVSIMEDFLGSGGADDDDDDDDKTTEDAATGNQGSLLPPMAPVNAPLGGNPGATQQQKEEEEGTGHREAGESDELHMLRLAFEEENRAADVASWLEVDAILKKSAAAAAKRREQYVAKKDALLAAAEQQQQEEEEEKPQQEAGCCERRKTLDNTDAMAAIMAELCEDDAPTPTRATREGQEEEQEEKGAAENAGAQEHAKEQEGVDSDGDVDEMCQCCASSGIAAVAERELLVAAADGSGANIKCGHSLCGDCLDRLASEAETTDECAETGGYFLCPWCRRAVMDAQ
eukprot:g558.t1